MQIINFFSESTGNALNIDYVQIPNDLDRLSDFEISEPEEDKVYLIEVSPNKPNNLKYHGVEIFLKSYFKSLTSGVEKVRFVLCGFEDELSFFKYSEFSQVLKLPNVSYLQINASFNENLLKFESDEIQKIDKSLALQGIRNVNIRRPLSYKTNHSIINEWSIFRWSQILSIEQNLPQYIKYEIKNSLFFRYLITINEIKEIDKISNSNLSSGISSTVLLIDDEEEKGWQSFFKTLLGNNVKFDSIGKDFKSEITKEGVIEKTKRIILQPQSTPDIVILDLRLHDHDYKENIQPADLTGIKILQEIKNFNRGIQVIVFSATNKALNLQYALDAGADGFIMKESPENSIQPTFSTDSVNNVISIIEQKSKMVFLRKIFTALEQIKTKIKDTISNDSDFINDISSNLDIAFDLLYKTSTDERYFNYAFIQLFLIIEQISTHECFFKEKGSCAYVINNNKEVLIQQEIGSKIQRALKLTNNGKYEIQENKFEKKQLRRLDTNFKVSSILIFRNGNINSSVKKWTNIYMNRNTKAAHFNKENINSKITIEDIDNIIDFISYFVDSKNVNELNIGSGLTEKSLEDALSELRRDPRVKNK